MDCKKVRDFISCQYNSGEGFPGEYMEHIENCISCRKLIKALELIGGGEVLRPPLAVFLEQKSLQRALESRGKGSGVNIKLIHLAAAAVLLVLLSVSVTLTVSGALSNSGKVVVHLYLYAPEAENVSVVGDWNSWTAGRDMLSDRDKDGRWEIKLKVFPGQEYRYQFLINGDVRISDPNAPFSIQDGFGGENSVLDI